MILNTASRNADNTTMSTSPAYLPFVFDADDAPLTEGTVVYFPACTAHGVDFPEDWAVITCITDPDGDVDDEGRMYGINPRVTVTFNDGETETFTTGTISYQRGDEYVCDDLTGAVHGPQLP